MKEVQQENEDPKGQWGCLDFPEKMALLELMDNRDLVDTPGFLELLDNR